MASYAPVTDVESPEQVFCYPIVSLRSDRVELRSVIPEVHYQKLHQVYRDHPEQSLYYDHSNSTEEGTLDGLRKQGKNMKQLGYAIYTAPIGTPPKNDVPLEEYEYAGQCSFQEMDKANLWAEIGISVFPPYKRSHVATHATGLMLHRLLDLPPSEGEQPTGGFPFPGLGMRRVMWRANTANLPSVNLGIRMGFQLEGIVRNFWVLGEGKVGDGRGRKGDAQWPKVSEDTWQGSITGLDWDEGVREIVDKQMARES